MEKTVAAYLPEEIYRTEENIITKTNIFAEMFDLHFQRIYSYIRYSTGNKEDAEDLTSQVFEQMISKYSSYRPERAPFEVWLFSIANNAVRDYFRKKKRWRLFPFDDLLEKPDPSPGPDEKTWQKDEQARLLNGISSLKERERNILALKFAAGFTNRRIAQLTELSESNVGIIIHRALKELKKTLDAGRDK